MIFLSILKIFFYHVTLENIFRILNNSVYFQNTVVGNEPFTYDIQMLICYQNVRQKISENCVFWNHLFSSLSFCMNYWINDHLAWFLYPAILPKTAYKVDVREYITKGNLSQHLFIYPLQVSLFIVVRIDCSY